MEWIRDGFKELKKADVPLYRSPRLRTESLK